MKKLKITKMKVFLMVLMSLTCFTIFAQDSNEQLDQEIQKAVQMYKLTDAQTSQFKSIVYDKSKEIKNLKEEASDVKSFNTELKVLQEKYDEKILAILDEDQAKIFQINRSMARNAVLKSGGNNN